MSWVYLEKENMALMLGIVTQEEEEEGGRRMQWMELRRML